MFEAQKNAIGTICFTTYNRGNLLLPTLKKILPEIDCRWPVLISNNASNQEHHAYNEIEEIASSHDNVYYKRHARNSLFEGNFISLFNLVPTQFMMLLSDEDYPCIESLNNLAPFLSKNRDIGAIRPAIGTLPNVRALQACNFKKQIFEKGQGIARFGLTGNYVSGAIYNVKLLNNLKVPQRLRKNLHAHQAYPHLYVNILAAANSRTMFHDTVTCLEGDLNLYEPRLFTDYFGAFSYGQRINQFIALRNVLLEAYNDVKETNKNNKNIFGNFYEDYKLLCSKYFMLILTAQGRMYHDNLISLKPLAQSFTLFCLGAVEHFPYFDNIKHSLAEDINLIAKHWLDRILTHAPKVAKKSA